jgi:hypothetical protein
MERSVQSDAVGKHIQKGTLQRPVVDGNTMSKIYIYSMVNRGLLYMALVRKNWRDPMNTTINFWVWSVLSGISYGYVIRRTARCCRGPKKSGCKSSDYITNWEFHK